MTPRIAASRSAAAYAGRRALPLLRIALWLPAAIIIIGESIKTANSALHPFTGFTPISVNVPNHCSGENPVVHVTRFVRQSMRGRFHTQFESASSAAPPRCAHDAQTRAYKPKPESFFATDMNDYFREGRACPLAPGRWRGEITWTFERPWHLDAEVKITTNPFEVRSPADPRCRGG